MLRTTFPNDNYTHAKIKGKLNIGSACHRSNRIFGL